MARPSACTAPREVILIGNGPSALAHRLGAHIDHFPNVVRFNEFQSLGFEPYVGGRLTLWAMSGNMAPTLLETYHERHQIPVLVAVPQRTYRNCTYPIVRRETLSRVPPAMRHRVNFTERGVAAELHARHGVTSRPSSGLLVLAHLLRHFRVVHIHGFDFFSGGDGKSGHYYADGKGAAGKVHDTRQETRVARQLVAEGRVLPLSECVAASPVAPPTNNKVESQRSSFQQNLNLDIM
ncbi:hypothetical protein EMIHUDRAFT_205179 [Emiliania huxleyi CCMP1516]|uniref:Uncharacterized protein n=2 Tax=Emiliania huxleyi TaxID=2903 RepID=A0A0D3JUL9_EMIH1|nr:hypothetical protein EMIHUDRAFT_205179 [Emiliania huxleyi CCMP1516]EOD27204.1 hypothetical protein EMIHUDRAFT_205179 [Emiliania huxleyi CCMP1516]|eukprot:XP_005779633.1 hypothetical protein EMIHUDRAFT_205179 [Emiliania huxleyi CCMP1516]